MIEDASTVKYLIPAKKFANESRSQVLSCKKSDLQDYDFLSINVTPTGEKPGFVLWSESSGNTATFILNDTIKDMSGVIREWRFILAPIPANSFALSGPIARYMVIIRNQ